MTDRTTPNAPIAREPRCVFCGKRKELREMDGVWLCPGPHEAIALDQLAALRSARDYWKGESDAASAALLAARREVERANARIAELEETVRRRCAAVSGVNACFVCDGTGLDPLKLCPECKGSGTRAALAATQERDTR